MVYRFTYKNKEMKVHLVFFGLVLCIIVIAVGLAFFHDIVKWCAKPSKKNKTTDIPPFIQIETRKIQRVRHQHIYSNQELSMFRL